MLIFTNVALLTMRGVISEKVNDIGLVPGTMPEFTHFIRSLFYKWGTFVLFLNLITKYSRSDIVISEKYTSAKIFFIFILDLFFLLKIISELKSVILY